MEAAGAPSPLERVQRKLAEARAARERRQRGAGGGGEAAGGAGPPAASAASSAASAPEEAWPPPPPRSGGASAPAGLPSPAEARVQLRGWGFSNGAPPPSASGGGGRGSNGRSGSGAWATTSEASSSGAPWEAGGRTEAPPLRRRPRPQTAKAAGDPRPAWNSSVTVKQRALGFQPIGGAPSGGGRRLATRNRAPDGPGFRDLDVAARRERQLLASQLREVNAASDSNQATLTKLYNNVGVAHSSSFGGRDTRTIEKARSALGRREQYSPERSLSPSEYGAPGSPRRARGDGKAPGLQPPAVAAAGEKAPAAAAHGPGRRARPEPGGGRGVQQPPLRPGDLGKNSHVIHLKIPSIVDDRLSSPKGLGRGARHGAAPATASAEAAAHVHLNLSRVLEPGSAVRGAGSPGSPAGAESWQPAAGTGFSTPSEMVFREWTPLQGASVTTNTGSQTDLSCLQSSTERVGGSNLARAGAEPEACPPRRLERPLSKHLSFVRSPRSQRSHEPPEGVRGRQDPGAASWLRFTPGRAGPAQFGASVGLASPAATRGALGEHSSSRAEPDEEGGQETGDPALGGLGGLGGGTGAERQGEAVSEAQPPEGEGGTWDMETDEVGRGLASACPGIATWSAERLLEELGKGSRMRKQVQWCGGKGSRRLVRLYLRGGLPFLEWDSRKKARTSSTAEGGQKKQYCCRVEAFSFEGGVPWTRLHALTVACSFGELQLRPASAPQYAQWVFGLNVGLWAADLPPEELDLCAVPAVVEWHAGARARPGDP